MSDTQPPMASVSEDTRVKTTINRLLTWGAGLVALTAVAVSAWSHNENRVDKLDSTAEDHSKQLVSVQVTVGGLRDEVVKIRADQEAQMNILKYIARDRKGPVPEELYKP